MLSPTRHLAAIVLAVAMPNAAATQSASCRELPMAGAAHCMPLDASIRAPGDPASGARSAARGPAALEGGGGKAEMGTLRVSQAPQPAAPLLLGLALLGVSAVMRRRSWAER
jgi:MYXO-CTERM domain-containing protein